MSKLLFEPIIIIGAARSGTKILRDTIASHPLISSIDYDINFIWKKYNEVIGHDALVKDHANALIIKFVHDYFNSKLRGNKYIVEKTVSNSLRIPFTKKVFPNAKFVYLIRDGRDVVESVLRQWGSAPDKLYLFKKMLSVPVIHIFPYLVNYGKEVFLMKSGLSPTSDYVWGVKYEGYQSDLQNLSLIEFCAKQWICGVEHMRLNEKSLGNRVITIHYEDFVENSDKELLRISEYLNVSDSEFRIPKMNTSNIGKSAVALSKSDYEKLNSILGSTLVKLGYTI